MKLDNYQQEVITANQNLLVIAGPGSGKTTTIIAKVKYLCKTINEKDIILLSFTNKSVDDLKRKLNSNIKILTFHKLAVDILKKYKYPYKVISNNTLSYIIDEYFLKMNNKDLKKLCRYLNILKFNKYSQEYISLKKLIITFINLFKTNNKDFGKLNNIVNNYHDKYLIKIILDIYYLYEEEKKSTNSLDYDDLIVVATYLLKKEYKYFNYKHIIIDEFQDTSYIRLNLIKEIYINSKSIITAVGDDAQSIFHFSGCDLNIFLNFAKHFPNSKTLYLKNTYRNSQELINISEKFIEKNYLQLKKNMISNIHHFKPIVFKYYYKSNKTLENVLKEVSSKSDSIMILGRNKKDIYKYLNNNLSFDGNYILFNNHKYLYLTIHSAKGLESDYVIILNMENSLYGVPNKLENHIILNYLFDNKKEIPYAEERRVFFVAITRCKYQTYLLIPRNNPSIFIREIK